MNKARQKRLEAKGWKFGTPKEFLGLSDQEAEYIELKLELADGLRAKRRQRGLGQVDVARMLGSSQSRVAKMEGGDPSVSIDLLIRSLLILGTSRPELARIMAR